MNTPTEIESRDEEVIDLRVLIATVLERKWWVGLSVVICTTIFTTAAFVITPTYRASTVLVPASVERKSTSGSLSSALGQLGGLASLAGISIGSGDSETEEALAVLKSREFTERFINDKQLMPDLFASKWDSVNHKWKVDVERQPTPAKAYEYFDKKIRSIVQDKKTGLITLQIDWKNRVEAAEWANELVRRLNSEMRTRAIAKADASVGYLEKELKATSVIATQEAINRLVEAQINQRMLANVTEEYVFRVADKAMVPDADDPISPKKLLLIAVGPMIGLAVGIFLILIFRPVRRKST